MSDNENTKRIAKNTLLLYGRMLFSLVISLYTSRVVLATLGVDDYGTYNAVGGIVAMFSLLSSSLSTAASRFLTFELGKGNRHRLKRIFSTTLTIHIFLVIIVLLFIETIGLWFLNTKMIIPTDRMYAANWVFQCTAFSFLLGMINVPYAASIISHERMNIFAFIGVLEVALKLIIVLMLAYASLGIDKLILYAVLYASVGVLLFLIYVAYCRRHFLESHVGLSFDKELLREMTGFAGWNFIGSIAGLLKDQGVNVLLNLFGGPIVNAARGLAFVVSSAVGSFVGNFMIALNPQITKSFASGDHDYMMSLVQRGARFSFYILLVLTLPLLFETDFVLTLWLDHYPDHTTAFVRLVLTLTMCDVLSNTLITLQLATGKIRNYQIAVGGMLLMNFPVSYVLLKMGYAPESTMLAAIVISLCCLSLRLIFLRKMIQLSIGNYVIHVLGNVLLVTVCALILPAIVYYHFSDGVLRFVFTGTTCVISTLLVILWIGCNRNERMFIFRKCADIFNTLKNK